MPVVVSVPARFAMSHVWGAAMRARRVLMRCAAPLAVLLAVTLVEGAATGSAQAQDMDVSQGGAVEQGAITAAPRASFMAGRRTLGWGRAFNNDYLGDGKDRWQTGSYMLSVLRGHQWTGALPDAPFEVMEYRLSVAITSPTKLSKPPAWDRRYAGRSQFMGATHWQARGLENMVGLGFTTTGKGNGIGDLHNTLHDWVSAPQVRVREQQIGNGVHPFVLAELGREWDLGGSAMRVFSQARVGDETLLRAGFDWQIGAREIGALWLRDEITGQRVVGISGNSSPGAWFTLGADFGHVWSSAYLPQDEIELSDTRTRVRAGVNMRHGDLGVFYGVTWLSKEFEAQPEGQVLGTLRVRANF